MIHRCEDWPSDDILKKRISDILEEHDNITFNQWQTTDRCKLITQTCPATEFIDILFFNNLRDKEKNPYHYYYFFFLD